MTFRSRWSSAPSKASRSTVKSTKRSVCSSHRAILRRSFALVAAREGIAWPSCLTPPGYGMQRTADALDAPSVVLSASIAFDYIMSFPGSFGDHILPEKSTVLSVSFLVESLQRLRGG